ncbi:MAG: hypothetical protein ACE5SW_02730 [Nitrososphaeraceae archaeon]
MNIALDNIEYWKSIGTAWNTIRKVMKKFGICLDTCHVFSAEYV